MRKNILISLGVLVIAAIGFFLVFPRSKGETPPVVEPIEVTPTPIASTTPNQEISIEETASQVAETTQKFWASFIAATDPAGNQSATNDLYNLLDPNMQSRIVNDTLQTPITIAQELDLVYLPNSFEVQRVTQESDTSFTAQTLLLIPNRESVTRVLTLHSIDGQWRVSSLK